MFETLFGWMGYSPTSQLTLAQSRITDLTLLTNNLNLVLVGMFVLVLVLVVALWKRPAPVYIQ